MGKTVTVTLAAEDEASKTVEDVASNFSKLGDVAETLKGVAADLSAAVGKLNEFFDRNSAGAKQQAEAMKQAGAAVSDASKGYTRMGEATADAGKEAQQAGQEFKQNAAQAEEMSQAAKDVGQAFGASGEEIKKAEQRLAEAKQQVSSLSTEMTGAKSNINSMKGEIAQLEAELLKAKSTTGTTGTEFKQLSGQLNQAKAGLKEAQAAVKPLENDLSKAKNEARLAGENLKVLKGDAGTLTGVLNSLKGEVADNTKALKEHGENSSKAGEALKGLAEKIKGMAPESEKTSGAAQGLVDKMGGLGKAGPVAAAAIAAVAAVAVDMGKKVLESALEVEQASKKMVAQLGATKQEAEQLKKTSAELFGTGLTGNIEESNGALVKTQQAFRGITDAAQIKKIAEDALVLKNTFGVDVNESLRTASTLSKNFGISGEAAFDIMTTGFQQTGDLSGDLLDTLNEYAPQFAQAGTDANQFLGTLITGSQAGAFNLDKIGDSIKEFRIRFSEGSDDFKNGLAAIGLNYGQLKAQVDSGSISIAQANELIAQKLTQVKSKTDEARIAAQLYGTQSEDLTTAILPALAQTTKGFE